MKEKKGATGVLEMLIRNKKIRTIGSVVLLFILLYQPIFGHLNTLPIRIWDESRLAMNAIEMAMNNNIIVGHYNGEPDMWNTKPTLLVWIQSLFIKIMGVNELSIRLPSAIATFVLCISLLVFSLRFIKSIGIGFITVLVLVTSFGFIAIHGSRTGDYEALMTLFTTLSGIYLFLHTESTKTYQLYLFYFFLALAVLTKGIGGLMFIPAFVLYIFYRKKQAQFLTGKHFYIGAVSFALIVLGYYFGRELFNPGYIQAVKDNELGGRFLEVLENHDEGTWYYLNNIMNYRFNYWHLFIPCGFFIGFYSKNQRIRRITIFSTMMAVSYLLVITIAQTKLEWYDTPIYPFLSILVAIFVHFVFSYLKTIPYFNRYLKLNVVPYLFLFLVMVVPYREILDATYKPTDFRIKNTLDLTAGLSIGDSIQFASNYSDLKLSQIRNNELNQFNSTMVGYRPIGYNETWNFYALSYYLKDVLKGKHSVENQFVIYNGYDAHIRFYITAIKRKGISVGYKSINSIKAQDIIIIGQDEVLRQVNDLYHGHILEKNGSIITYYIDGKK